jgi:Ca-activated chloride channel homolog
MRTMVNGITVGIIVLALAGCAGVFGPEAEDEGEATLSLNVHGLAGFDSSDGAVGAQSIGGEFTAQAMDPSGIVSAVVEVDALNFSAPETEPVSLTSGAGTATLTSLPIGPNRVIKVVGQDADGNAVAGAEIYATVDLYPGSNSVTVNWNTTPRGRVFAELLAQDRSSGTEYSVTVDAADMQTKIEGIISANGLGHPNVVDAVVLAGDIISDGGTIPSSDDYVRPTGEVNIDITGLGSSVGWPVEIVVTDPTSQPVSVTGDGAYTIDEVLPGDWDMVVSVNNGAYQEVLTVTQISGGSSISTATDADGNDIDLQNWDLSGDLDISIGMRGAYVDTSDTTTTDVSATINQVTADSSGNVGGYVSFTDQNGDPISNLNEFNFEIEESLDNASWTTLASGSFTATSVSNAGQSISTVMTMDYSGSMSSTDISNMESATSSFVSNMSASDQAALLKFGGDIYAYPSSGFSSDTTDLEGYVTQSFPGYTGSTALYDAVGQGLDMLETGVSSGLKAVIAFTDGSDNGSSTWSQQDVIDYSNNNAIPVYSVGFGSANTTALENIATSGVYEYAPDSSTLSDIYDQIANRLRETYVVNWETIGTSGDTVYVRVSVTYTSANGSYTETVTTSYTL